MRLAVALALLLSLQPLQGRHFHLDMNILFSPAECTRDPDLTLASALMSVNHALEFTNNDPSLPTISTNIDFTIVPECSLLPTNHTTAIIYGILRTEAIPNDLGFRVIIGPFLLIDCNFVSDFIAVEPPTDSPLKRVYQINTMCHKTANFVYRTNTSSPFPVHTDIAEMGIFVADSVIINVICRYLTVKGWARVVVLYEIGRVNFGMEDFAQLLIDVLEMEQLGLKLVYSGLVSRPDMLEASQFKPDGRDSIANV